MYDAIIVGARCAGAPTATLLARKGYRVLLVDKATFPSDVVSTLIVWPHGAELLDRWGLLDRLAATGCPPVARRLLFDVGPFALSGGVIDTNGGRGGFCPRRTVLDKILVDAAVEAGAEVREAFTVDSLLWDGDRVAGIRGHSRTGKDVEERARVTIGADGVHSRSPRVSRRREDEARPPLTTNYYSYFSGFGASDLEQDIREYLAIGCFPTHDGLTLIAVMWPAGRFDEIRTDIEGHVPEGARIDADRRGAAARCATRGTMDRRGRRPQLFPSAVRARLGARRRCGLREGPDHRSRHQRRLHRRGGPGDGPGPSLVGRASTRRDIWRRNRRAATAERNRCTTSRASWRRWNRLRQLMQRLFRALRGNQDATNRFYSAITGSRPLPEFMNPENLDRIIAGATTGAHR